VRDSERQSGVDALRGIALFLILFVNLEFLSQTLDEGWDQPQFAGVLDQSAHWLLVAVFQLKAYLIFALLFGYGLAIQVRRASDTPGLRRRYRRRMVGLLVLGFTHGAFFFAGDILMIYGVVGLALWWFRDAAPLTLLRAAVGIYVAGLVLVATIPFDAGPSRDVDAIRDTYANGSFVDVAGQRLEDLAVAQSFNVVVQGASVLAFFLIGLALGRENVFAAPERHTRLLRWLTVVALPIGLAGCSIAATLGAIRGWNDDAAFVVQALSGPFSALGYVGAFGYLLATGRARGLVRLAAPVGRMSLTVYLAESLVASLIFNGYGLGFYGSAGPFAGLILSIAIWLAFVPFERLWLTRFRFGPAEWLLRSWTYGCRQPLRAARGRDERAA
jgi:uncharacterized protein